MNLTPMQLFCQKEIIKRTHPGLSLEDANAEEAKLKGSIVRTRDKKYREILYYNRDTQEYRDIEGDRFDSGNFGTGQGVVENTVIGLPPTLARVLHCLAYIHHERHIVARGNRVCHLDNGIDRKLLNEDGTDATLRDQSDETQNAIALLFGWEDE